MSEESITGPAADALRQYVSRIERLKDEIKALNEDVSQVYHEAKASGFDTKVLKMLIAERAKDPRALQELNELVEMYRAAIDGTGIAIACTGTRAAA